MFPHLAESCSLAGLASPAASPEAPWGEAPRDRIAWIASRGFRSIQLDGALSGIRARDLDRSARRDLAALLKRSGLDLSGIDLWIPAAHFASAAHADRAVAAVLSACELAAELSALLSGLGRIVAVDAGPAPSSGVLESLGRGAQRLGVELADHRWPRAQPGPETPTGISIGIDPASIIAQGSDPATEVSRLSAPPSQARLSDLSGIGRTIAGRGRLDVAGYEAALFTRGYTRALVVDPRGLPLRDAATLQPSAASTSSGMSALL